MAIKLNEAVLKLANLICRETSNEILFSLTTRESRSIQAVGFVWYNHENLVA